ncbi:hypothetical protein BYT27DRAFT_7157555 [Phlegmacium glaucopus]|nr:hypothetical protein BYT27DRAFT_7157555 [Phlegmacium glaucopus]
MGLRFQTSRRMLCSLLAFTSAVSVFMGALLSPYFLRRGFAWFLVVIEIFSLLRAVWSAIRKPVFDSPQTVASEAISLFVLFPFHLVVAMIIDTISPKQGNHAVGFLVLQGFAISGTVIHLTYTGCLLLVALLTIAAFDRDVWLRDLDSSPSPFPMQVLFTFVFPCLVPLFEAAHFVAPQPSSQEPTSLFCLPCCNCELSKFPPDFESIDQHELPVAATNRSMKCAPANVSARTLVRVPNAAEQRDSIVINLSVNQA